MSTLPSASILSFWFPSKEYQSFWFDGSRDHEIQEKYKEMLTYCKNEENINELTTTYDEKLASIIVLDQFSRSIHRKNDDYSFMEDTELAHKLSYSMIVDGADILYPISYRLFILMPYRHLAVLTNNSALLDVVISKLDDYEKECGSSSLLQRFRNATYQNFTVTTDRILRYRYDNPSGTIRDYDDVLDPLCKGCGVSIEEVTTTTITSLPLYQTMKRFFTSSSSIPNIGVSLSGGVDSMVILYVLKTLLDDKCIKSVYALHLSYTFSAEIDNKETEQSKNLIGMYCSLLNIPLYTRMIPYCREKTDRLFYEEETKAARFASYRYLSKKHNIEGWCLGHHHGDVGENVMMNLCSGRSLLELKVMDKTSRLYDVTLYRPLLDHPKSDIYAFAHTMLIPYLKDTTPDWACRGVLRRKVFPPLIDQYPAILQTLENISNESYEWKMVVEQFVIEPIKSDIVFDSSKKTATMRMRGVLPKVVWSSVFLYIFHSMGINMISHKNVAYFCDMYERNILRKNRFMFSNNCVGIFMENRESETVTMMLRIVRLNEK
jgi:tRNA(Ile)-lysidine synthetase-like protein